MGMALKMSPDEALSVAFRKDWWLLLKVPIAAYLAWSFFLPQLWKIGVLVITALVSTFRFGSPIGQDVSGFHLYFMLGSMLAIVFGVFWYGIYVFAYVARPGVAARAIGIAGVLLFPVLLITVALVVGGIGAGLGVPQETFWGYLDRWTPIEAWRTRHAPHAADLDDAVRGQRPKDLWLTLDRDSKYVDCLHHHVAVMRRRVGLARGPSDLLNYYPKWLHEVDECSRLYQPDPNRSARLREALATQMAVVLGQETTSYLTMHRLYALDPTAPTSAKADWIDKWRVFAVVGVAGTADVLEDAK
jgi:hypothetical protein